MSSPPVILKSEKGMHVMLLNVPGRTVWAWGTAVPQVTPSPVASILWLYCCWLLYFFIDIVVLLFCKVLSHWKKKHCISTCCQAKVPLSYAKKQQNKQKTPEMQIPGRERKWKHCINISILPPFQWYENDSQSKTGNSVSNRSVYSHRSVMLRKYKACWLHKSLLPYL